MKKLCLIHANCQGEPLADHLSASAAFSRAFEIRHVTNYVREDVPAEALSSCGVFLYQHLGPKWGELASERLLAKLPPEAVSLCIPALFFKGCWPFWSSRPGFDFSDLFLDALLDRGLAPEEAAYLYLRRDISTKFDIPGLIEESLAHERAKEAHTPIKYLDFVLENYRDRSLFWTINHPRRELLRRVGDEVLARLGFPPLSEAEAAGVPEHFAEFELPVHPQVAEMLGLAHITPETRFHVFGGSLTFAEYVRCYVDCKAQGIEDFIGYLRIVAPKVRKA